MVRSLTLAGLEVKKSLEESYLRDEYASSSMVLGKRKNTGGLAGDAKRMRRDTTPEEDSPLPQSSLFIPPSVLSYLFLGLTFDPRSSVYLSHIDPTLSFPLFLGTDGSRFLGAHDYCLYQQMVSGH